MSTHGRLSRRRFLGTAARTGAAASLAGGAPALVPASVFGKT